MSACDRLLPSLTAVCINNLGAESMRTHIATYHLKLFRGYLEKQRIKRCVCGGLCTVHFKDALIRGNDVMK